MLERFRLDGQVALITGAGRGIGAAIARGFAEQGASVILAARTQSELDTTAEACRRLGAESLAVPTDVMNEEHLDQLLAAALDRFGRLDILVNNAGGYPPKPISQTTTAQFEAAFRFNVGTAFSLTRRCAPVMVETAGGGAIVNISSVAGTHPSSWFSAYGTAKAALSMLTRECAQEFAPKIRVNAIAVGSTRTEALKTVLTPEIEQQMVELTPMARLAEVEDIALGAMYLASPASSYVTGEILGIHGGMLRLNMDMPTAF